MIQLQRVLFPTDFSELSKSAERYACALADQFRAELHVLHVLEDVYLFAPDPAAMVYIPPNLLNEARKNAEQAISRVPSPEWSNGKRVVHATRNGSPHVEIVNYAKEKQIDLIVIGTHGRTGLTHLLLGSVAERVVQHAGCPVLTVRSEGTQFVKNG